MRNYKELDFRIIRFENCDVITGSDNDNVSGADEGWTGWSNDEE